MKLRAENIALNCGFCKKSLQVPFGEEKSVQLFRVAFFRSNFIQNPYFSNVTSTETPQVINFKTKSLPICYSCTFT